jgi:sugar-specific transcriptional regulator TrmB
MTQGDEHDDDALADRLRVFGLSDTEVDTYLALLEVGEAPTSTVSEMAGVTRRAVYDIADRLDARGLVRVNDHASPTTIRALPPDEALDNLSEHLESIRPALKARYNETEPQAPEIQVVKSRETALKRLRTAISGAEHEVLVAIPERVYPEIAPELRDAVDRGLLVFLLLGDTSSFDGDGRQFEDAASVVRYWKESLPFLYTVDDRSAMIGDADLLSGPHSSDDEAVTVSTPQLSGSILGMYFGAYWPASTEAYVTDRDALPKTYDWFRQAILHAILHDVAGVALHADVETEAGESFSGPVTDVRQAFVDPTTNGFTLENSILVETDAGTVSVGGRGSFIEDCRAASVTLRRAEDA